MTPSECSDPWPSPDEPLEVLIQALPGFDPYALAGECVFDLEAAELAVRLFETVIVYPDGPEAGQPIRLMWWQKAVLACLFGWKRPDGRRRFREVFVYVPKKNAKSAFAAGIVLLVMLLDGDYGMRLFSAACSREQAALVFEYGKNMVALQPALAKLVRVYGGRGGQQRSMVHEKKAAVYRVLASDADTADGVNPHLAIVDETHRHKTPELAEVLEKSTAAQAEPIVIHLTTADYDRPSLCNSKLRYAKLVLANPGDRSQPGYDPAFLPVVFETLQGADWRDPSVWRRANPSYGVTVSEEFMRREARKAADSPTELANFLRLHLNMVTTSDVAYLSGPQWDENAGDPTIESAGGLEEWIAAHGLEGRRCLAGLDLGRTIDVSAVVYLFDRLEEGAPYIVLPRYWIPEDTARQAEDRDRVPYALWRKLGFMEFTPGNVVDFRYIREAILADSKRFKIRELGYDPLYATELALDLSEAGVKVVQVGQTARNLSEPMDALLREVNLCGFAHGANPVLRWNALNLQEKRLPSGMVLPNKSNPKARIDGISALLVALAREIIAESQAPSVYESRGPIII